MVVALIVLFALAVLSHDAVAFVAQPGFGKQLHQAAGGGVYHNGGDNTIKPQHETESAIIDAALVTGNAFAASELELKSAIVTTGKDAGLKVYEQLANVGHRKPFHHRKLSLMAHRTSQTEQG